VEECTYFWGVNTSWGINMAESKRPINQEDNQAPQPTLSPIIQPQGLGFLTCLVLYLSYKLLKPTEDLILALHKEDPYFPGKIMNKHHIV
jgi:hypothetical protein